MTEPNIGIIVQQLNTMAREGEKVSDIDTSREAVEGIAAYFEKYNAPKHGQIVRALLDERDALRQKLFNTQRSPGSSHTTACSIWGDDGQGGTREGFKGLPCNCGALEHFQFQRAEAAEKALTEIHAAFTFHLLADSRLNALSRICALDCFDRARSTDHKPASEGKPELLCEKCQTPGAYILPRVGYWVHAYEHADKSRDHDFVPRFAPAPEQHP